MKIRMIICAVAAMLALTGCGRGTVRAAEQKMESSGATVSNSMNPAGTINLISRERAEQIALDHAGLTADQVTGMRAEYDTDHGYPEYDVEFRSGGREYEFEIDAENGEILSYSVED